MIPGTITSKPDIYVYEIHIGTATHIFCFYYSSLKENVILAWCAYNKCSLYTIIIIIMDFLVIIHRQTHDTNNEIYIIYVYYGTPYSYCSYHALEIIYQQNPILILDYTKDILSQPKVKHCLQNL